MGCPSGTGNCQGVQCDFGCTVCPAGTFSKVLPRGVDVGRAYQHTTYFLSLYESYLWTRHKKMTAWLNWYNGDTNTFQNAGIRLDAPRDITVGTVTDERQYLKCLACPTGQSQPIPGQDRCVAATGLRRAP